MSLQRLTQWFQAARRVLKPEGPNDAPVMQMNCYLLHQGVPANRSYSLHARSPRVITRPVRELTTGKRVMLYQTPTPFLLNFCTHGVEHGLGLKDLPLGGIAHLQINVLAVKPHLIVKEHEPA